MGAVKVFGVKIPTKYGGLGPPMSYYDEGLMLVGSVHPSVGAPAEDSIRLRCRRLSALPLLADLLSVSWEMCADL